MAAGRTLEQGQLQGKPGLSSESGAVMNEGGFLAAILADAPRLVYGDWLEEQCDPRAEFLRAESQFLKSWASTASERALLPALRSLCVVTRCPPVL